MDRGAWRATIHFRKESDTTERLDHHHRVQSASPIYLITPSLFRKPWFFFVVVSSINRSLHKEGVFILVR